MASINKETVTTVEIKFAGDKSHASCAMVDINGAPHTFNAWGRNGVEAATKLSRQVRKKFGPGVRLRLSEQNTIWRT